jgi:diaminopimelate epimerase
MKSIPFYKMSGAGNDFILIDNRTGVMDELTLIELIKGVCRHKLSVGADGVILIENSDTVDFRWRFFNADASVAEMCGNGARCAARMACMLGIAQTRVRFETIAGIIDAEVAPGGQVKIRLTDPSEARVNFPVALSTGISTISSINTGVPHVVIEMEDVAHAPVRDMGREVRYHNDFSPAGTNVNFVSKQTDGMLAVRTYERGVENETLACGTGATASALIMAHRHGLTSPVRLTTKSGSILTIYFEQKDGRFYNLYLEGDARLIYTAQLNEEAWK